MESEHDLLSRHALAAAGAAFFAAFCNKQTVVDRIKLIVKSQSTSTFPRFLPTFLAAFFRGAFFARFGFGG